MGNKKYIISFTAAVIVLAVLLTGGFLNSPEGEKLFITEKCIDCHSFKGRGGAIGPDLTAVAERRSEGWIYDQIRHPEKHNPDTRMPPFGHLSRGEIKALVRYFKG